MHSIPGNKQILVAETEKAVRDSLSFILKEEGFSYRSVSDITSLQNEINSGEYDLLIIDRVLLSSEVEELIVEQREAGTAIPVIITLFYEHLDGMIGLIDMGINDFVLKPFQFCDLLTRIKQLLSPQLER
jgi:DNA-binding response OmpR family regulator